MTNCNKIPDNNLGNFYLARHLLEHTVDRDEDSMALDVIGGWSYCIRSMEAETEMNVHAQFTYTFVCSLRVLEWCHLHLEWVLLSQLTSSSNCSQTYGAAGV